jgi:hypothetical protein
VAYTRVLPDGAQVVPTMDGEAAIKMELRYQVPASVLPLKLEGARLFVKVTAPDRRFTVHGTAGSGQVEVVNVEGSTDVQRDLPEALLRLDKDGTLHLEVEVGQAPEEREATRVGRGGRPRDTRPPPRWKIDTLELQVVGQTLPEH